MSLSNGRSYLAIPGPSVVPDAVLRAMHRASPNIYEGELAEMMPALAADLKRVARTEHHVAFYIGNGHAAWEAALSNVIEEGDAVLVPTTGRFSHGWGDMATGLGAEVETLDFGLKKPMDLNAIEARLRLDGGHKIKAILAVHVDTSTSIKNDIAGLRAVLDATGHPALLMADCIASLGCDRFEMDAWGADIMVAASQKGLMVTPGLGFVFFNERANEVRKNMRRVSRYWDWTPRHTGEILPEFFGGTPPTHLLYGLRAALDILHGEGIEAVWDRHATLARAVWAACEAWGQGGPLEMNVADPAHRSHAVSALYMGGPKGLELRQWCERETGVTLGVGLAMRDQSDPKAMGHFRIGHMGHVNAHMVMGVLGVIQAGFDALDVPYGAGGLDAAARILSGKA